MEKIELKSCPFCGGDGNLILASTVTGSHPASIKNNYYVKCFICGSQTMQYESDIRQEDDGDIVIKSNGAELAAKAWNRRFEDTIKFFKDAVEKPIDSDIYVTSIRLPLNLEDEKNEN